MTRLLLALAIGGLASGSWQARPETAPTLRLDVVAVDGNGTPIDNLTAADLEISIDGYRVPIESLTAVTAANPERGGRITVLLLDDLVVPLPQTARVREVARRFVTRMAPGDRMAVVSLNGESIEITDDRSRLFKRIDDYSVRAGPVLRFDTIGEHVLETATSLSRLVAEQADGRKTIVGIGAGWLFDAPLPPPSVGRDLRPEWTAAMRAMAFANVSLYVIDPGGIGSSPFGGASGFARETGGYAFVNTNDLNGTADRIMRETASYYVLEVPDPPVGRKAKLRELNVKVLRRGLTVRARRQIPGGG
jgi:VWFA-related protein